jgi:hypothetical protein
VNRFLLATLAVTLGTGFTACQKRPTLDPVPAQCDSACLIPCDTKWPLWAPVDPEDPRAFDDRVLQVDVPAREKLEACEVKRGSCQKCLESLERRRVITL